MTDRDEQLARLADDQLRTAQAALASKLRRLGDAAYQAALDVDAGELGERFTFDKLHARHAAAREAMALLSAARQGARTMREQQPLRSASDGTGRA